jgi:lipoprotein-anchoring transpeptidase ErfK/SrfK
MARRRKQARARSPQGESLWIWAAILILAGVVGWVWWRAAYPPAGTRSSLATAVSAELDHLEADIAELFPTLVPPTSATPSAPATPVAPVVEKPARSHEAARDIVAPKLSDGAAATTTPAPETGAVPLSRDQVVAAQIALARHGFSCGSIDGVAGSQTRAAVRGFQRKAGLPETGVLDLPTLARLSPKETPFTHYVVTEEDLNRLTPVPSGWFAKSTRERLDYETILELVAEKSRSHPRLLRDLNRGLDWTRITAGTRVITPAIEPPRDDIRAARIVINLGERALRAYDSRSNLLAQYPCSIARQVGKRPVGTLRVNKIAPNPNYRFDPEIFRESPEARQIGRRLMIPPGPNNPVGTAWIGLDRPGYGIHGTPHPEDVGRTESHGCFRLANWDAEHLLKLSWVGMPVEVHP